MRAVFHMPVCARTEKKATAAGRKAQLCSSCVMPSASAPAARLHLNFLTGVP